MFAARLDVLKARLGPNSVTSSASSAGQISEVSKEEGQRIQVLMEVWYQRSQPKSQMVKRQHKMRRIARILLGFRQVLQPAGSS